MMRNSLLDFIGLVATAALLGTAIRWLYTAKGSHVPKTIDDTNVYDIMWQWRALAWVAVAFWVVVSVWSWRDERRLDPVLTVAIASILGAAAIGSGSVTTNETGILKKFLWRKTSFQWPEVTQVLLHRKRGLAVELRG
jgi:hypothetical protein